MPIICVDGEISDIELAVWNVALPPTEIDLTCEEVRAIFFGTPLARGIAMLELSREQLKKLFPTKSRQKNAWNLMGFARHIKGQEARRALHAASWHQLRAAAVHDNEHDQIVAALSWRLSKKQ